VWSKQHVYRWAREVLNFSEADAAALKKWRGRFLTDAVPEQVPAALSDGAAALLLNTQQSKNWSLLQQRQR
jgi:hypothetical protein